MQQSQLAKLKAKNYTGSDDEWKDTILHVFGAREGLVINPDSLRGIESSANICVTSEDEKELVITIRKRIQSITVRTPQSWSISFDSCLDKT